MTKKERKDYRNFKEVYGHLDYASRGKKTKIIRPDDWHCEKSSGNNYIEPTTYFRD